MPADGEEVMPPRTVLDPTVLEAVVGVPNTHIRGTGRIAPGAVRDAFLRADPAIRACAERMTFVLSVDVRADGSVAGSYLMRHSLSTAQEECIHGVVATLRFPMPLPEESTATLVRRYMITEF